MKLILNSTILLFLTLFLFSCRKDFDFDYATSKLEFSKDTIFLDTIFNAIRSQTYVLKVYNTEDKDVKIKRINLEKPNSYYKINVDGKAGSDFSDVSIRKKDSLFIFVEVAIKDKANESIVEEKLFFETENNKQFVTLFSIAEDVEFFKPATGNSSYEITTNTTWTNNKPKLIFAGGLNVSNGAKFTIEQGTKIYLYSDASLNVKENSELIINGTKSKEVLIRGHRQEERYDTLYGNWKQINIEKNAKTSINFARIQGGTNGLVVNENAQAVIKNTKFFNHHKFGLYGRKATISGENLVFNNCGNVAFSGNSGTYNFTHCTFSNSSDFVFTPVAVELYDSYVDSEDVEIPSTVINAPINATFKNSIIYGKSTNAFKNTFKTANTSTFSFENCLLKIQEINNANFINCIFNQDPLFKNIEMSVNLLNVPANSPVIGKGSVLIATQVPKDIAEVARTTNPTIGAYQ